MISHVEDTEANELINELVILSVKEPRNTSNTTAMQSQKGNVLFALFIYLY